MTLTSQKKILLFALLLAGCVTVSSGNVRQTVRTYTFAPEGLSANARAISEGPILLVSHPTAASGYGSRLIIYTEQPFELAHYAFSEWANSPQTMLDPLLVVALGNTGAFESIVDISYGVMADVRLDTEIVTLQQEFLTSPSEVRIVLRAHLVDLEARELLATQTFEVIETAPSDDAYGGVVATNRALTRLLVMVADFCVENVTR